MSSHEFVVTIPMPFTGESIIDGILVNWLVEPGETVQKGQHIAEIETEKSVWEFEAPCEGEILSLRAKPGDVVEVKAPLLDMKTVDANVRHLLQQQNEAAPAIINGGNGKGVVNAARSRISISPRAKKLLRDRAISDDEAKQIPGTGPDGRLTADDVERHLRTEADEATQDDGKTIVSYIAGMGAYVPQKIVSNSIFAPHFPDISESYIEKVTGIKERRWVDAEKTSDMAVAAAEEAIENSGLRISDIDMIILATTTPDMPLPATACAVQQRLGCENIPAFDMQAACSGWLYALSVAQQFLRTRTCKNILVIAAETMSVYTDQTDRATAFLFGDGAGAAVLSSERVGHILTDIVLRADSTGYDIIYRKAGGSEMPPRRMASEKDEFWYMDGGRMFRSAVTNFSQIIESVATKARLALKDVRWFVPHQANQRILKSVAQRIKALPERFFSNIRHLGNTSAASIPLALKDLEKKQVVASGDKLLLCAVGAGLTAAGCVVTWK